MQEAAQDKVTGRGAVHEEKVVVLEASIYEASALVDLPVQPHHISHIVLPEVREVGLWSMKRVTWERKLNCQGDTDSSWSFAMVNMLKMLYRASTHRPKTRTTAEITFALLF